MLGSGAGDFLGSMLESMEGFVPALLRCEPCAPCTRRWGQSAHQGTCRLGLGTGMTKPKRALHINKQILAVARGQH